MHTSTLQRLATILKRELGATNVQIIAANEEQRSDTALTWDISRGRKLLVTFAAPPTNIAEKREHLATLVDSFADLFADVAAEMPRPRPQPTEALKAELNALAGHAGAWSAVIIDAASPVIWGASEAPTDADENPLDPAIATAFARMHELGISWLGLLKHPPGSLLVTEPKESKPAEESGRTLRLVRPVDELAGLSTQEREIIARRAELTCSAIAKVRQDPILSDLHHGKHLHEAIANEKLGLWARSFATIYVLILVFPGPFDELGAERAAIRALPSIERLVVALPPDDTPTHRKGAVVALRPRRR